jgi:superfamily I DNA/RNA helicase
VKHFKCSTISEQCDIIVAALETQLQAYPGELLGIICPQHKELEQVKDILSRSRIANLCVFQDPNAGYVPFDSQRPICLSTLHSAKGLEFRALHMVACDTLKKFPQNNRNMTFTGVTRAKTSLSLYYIDDLYGYFERALTVLSPRLDLPTISEVFGRGD